MHHPLSAEVSTLVGKNSLVPQQFAWYRFWNEHPRDSYAGNIIEIHGDRQSDRLGKKRNRETGDGRTGLTDGQPGRYTQAGRKVRINRQTGGFRLTGGERQVERQENKRTGSDKLRGRQL